MAAINGLSDTVARLRAEISSIYTQKELDEVVAKPKSAPSREANPSAKKATAADSDSDDSVGKGSLSSLTDGDSDDPFCTRRKAKDLGDIIAEGRGRLTYLSKKLKTPQRVEAIKDLADWFEHRAPEVCREMEELNNLERRHNDIQVDDLASAAALATREMEEDVANAVEKVDHFYHHLVDEMGGAQALHKFEQRRRSLQIEYDKLNLSSDDAVRLQEATDELQRLQDRYQMISDPLHGLEAMDQDDTDRLNELKQAIGQKYQRLGDLQRVVDESGSMLTQLQKVMAAIKLENRGGLSVLEPQLQNLAAKLKDRAQRGADSLVEKNNSVSAARGKAESEEGEAEKLERQLKDLEEETKSRLGIMRIVAVEEVAQTQRPRRGSSSSLEDDEEDDGDKVKMELVEALQNLRQQKSAMMHLQASSLHSEGQLANLQKAQVEVRQNFRMALERLQREDQESMVRAADERPPAVTPTEWRKHLEDSWSFAMRDPELFARCLWLEPISDEGDDFIMGSAGTGSYRKAAASSSSTAGDEGEDTALAELQESVSELRMGQMKLWQQLDSLEDTLGIGQTPQPEQPPDAPPPEDGPEASLEKLRYAIEAEDAFAHGTLQEIAHESLFDAAALEWLAPRLVPLLAQGQARAAHN